MEDSRVTMRKKHQPEQVGIELGASGISDNENSPGNVRSFARGLRILRCFEVETPAWTLSDLARYLNLNRGTVHRFLKTLETEGFLTYEPETRKFYLGTAAFRLGQVANMNSELIRVARPHMESVALRSSEAVSLGAWTGDGVV